MIGREQDATDSIDKKSITIFMFAINLNGGFDEILAIDVGLNPGEVRADDEGYNLARQRAHDMGYRITASFDEHSTCAKAINLAGCTRLHVDDDEPADTSAPRP